MNTYSCLVQQRTYTVYGASADLIQWIRRSRLAQQILAEAKASEEQLFVAFGATNDAERVNASKAVIKKLWDAWPALGPYPFLDTLSEFEFARVFYADYRDHVCHQLKVFLLGLMVYEGCASLRAALDETMQVPAAGAPAFALRWLVTAVYHDLGYVLENEGANQRNGAAWQKTRTMLNEVLAAPLSKVKALAPLLPEEIERQLINDNEIFTARVDSPKDLESIRGEDLFSLLREDAERAGLAAQGKARPPLRVYYDYALSHLAEGGKRPTFRDHGIASALLLIKTWQSYSDHVRRMLKLSGERALDDARPLLQQIEQGLPGQRDTILAAASAMALHNITPSIWDKEEAIAYGLSLSKFRIKLLDKEKRSPLAFLLGMVDCLQDWDRPKFRGAEGRYLDQDLSIRVRGGRILMHVVRDAEMYKKPDLQPDSGYSQAMAAMKQYLDVKAIEELICWDWGTEETAAEGATPYVYFANICNRWHAIQGVGEVSEEAQRKRNRTYRFTLIKDQVQRVELINGRGRSVENENGVAAWEHHYDAAGRLIYITELNRMAHTVSRTLYSTSLDKESFVDRHDLPRKRKGSEVTARQHQFDKSGYTTMLINMNAWGSPRPDEEGAIAIRYQRDAQGLALHATAVTEAGKPSLTKNGLHENHRTFDALGNETSSTFFDAAGKLVMHEHGYAVLKSEFDAAGNEVKREFFDADRRPTWLTTGFAAWRSSYDEWGNRRQLVNLDTNGEPTLDKNGVAELRVECDEYGNEIRASFHDTLGRLAFHKNGFAGMQSRHDEHGHEVSVTFLGIDGKPALNKYGVSRVDRAYDARGNQVSDSYFDAAEKPCLNVEGIAGWQAFFDDKDHETERRWLGVNGELVLNNEGYASWRSAFDERGNQVEMTYLGTDGKPVLQKDRIAGSQAAFNERGAQIEFTYLDTKGNPTLHRNGYAGWRARYDDRGNLIEVMYLDTSRRPFLMPRGYAGERRNFDERGNSTGVDFLDVSGNSMLQNEGIAGYRLVLDERGREIERNFIGAKGEPVLHSSGVAGTRSAYDQRGLKTEFRCVGISGDTAVNAEGVAGYKSSFNKAGQEIERRYFGADGQPALHRDGMASWRCEIDERGNTSETAFFDLRGEPVLHAFGHAIMRTAHDPRGAPIKQSYLGTDRRPILSKDGYASRRWTLDERGRQVSDSFYGLLDQPILIRAGYHCVRWKYDALGNRIEDEFFDTLGQRLPISP